MKKEKQDRPRRQAWHWGQHKVVADKKRAHKRGHRKHKGGIDREH